MIISWSGKTQIKDNVRSTLFEEGRQRIRAIAERRVAGVIENEGVEGLTLKFGKVSAHLSRPQNGKIDVVVFPGKDDDIGGYPNGLGGTHEKERSGDDLQDGDCDEEVDPFQGTASPPHLSGFIVGPSRLRDRAWPLGRSGWTLLWSKGLAGSFLSKRGTSPSFVLHTDLPLPSWNLFGCPRDDDRDVVCPAALVREGDQDVARGLRIARFDDDALNVLVFHVVDQAVATQQDAVTRLHREASDVRRDLIVDSEGHRDHVLPRVMPRVLGRQLPPVDHLLDEGVVPRHLVDLSRIDDVRAGVAGVGHMESATIGDRKAEGRPHPFTFRMYLGLRE